MHRYIDAYLYTISYALKAFSRKLLSKSINHPIYIVQSRIAYYDINQFCVYSDNVGKYTYLYAYVKNEFLLG